MKITATENDTNYILQTIR